MTTGRYRRRNATFRPPDARRSDRENNFFFGILGFSLFIHVIVAALLLHNPTATIQRRPPTVYVDLVMAPVANPQRGSGGALRKVAPPTSEQKTAALPPKVIKPEKTPKGPIAPSDDLGESIAAMRKKLNTQAELDDAQKAIAAMRKKTALPPQTTAVAGSVSGTGDEAGSAINEWLQQAVKSKWTWPDRKRKDLSAEVEVEFDIRGKLSKCDIQKPSSDPRFDASLKRAILSIDSLPMALRKPYKETILFNLEDLQP